MGILNIKPFKGDYQHILSVNNFLGVFVSIQVLPFLSGDFPGSGPLYTRYKKGLCGHIFNIQKLCGTTYVSIN